MSSYSNYLELYFTKIRQHVNPAMACVVIVMQMGQDMAAHDDNCNQQQYKLNLAEIIRDQQSPTPFSSNLMEASASVFKLIKFD
jgi:hypothetical protein